MIAKKDITGLVLAGGRGSRMGYVDKGLMLFQEIPLVVHTLMALTQQVRELLISANQNYGRYASFDAMVLSDEMKDFPGPLAGLQAGLRHCKSAYLQLAPCDTPFLPDDLVSRLAAALEAENADLALAVTQEPDSAGQPRRQTHPVICLLKTSIAPELEAYLAEGGRRMDGWFDRVKTVEVLFEDATMFANINTLAQLNEVDEEADEDDEEPEADADDDDEEPEADADDDDEDEDEDDEDSANDAVEAPALNSVASSCVDAYAPDALSVEDAQRIVAGYIGAAAMAGETETLPLFDALDRVLAADIVSPINVPAYDNSAMDGYVLRGRDLAVSGPTRLRVVGTTYAGRPAKVKVGRGECLRIMTGGLMPAGCDSVVPQELVTLDGGAEDGHITLAAGAIRAGDNRRLAGEDLAAGGAALSKGKLLRPAELGLLASLGIAHVTVRRRLRVAFFSTGDELRPLGKPLPNGCVYDSNRYTLYGMLRRLGCDVIDMGIVPDKPAALQKALREACVVADAIITSGGVSVGAADHTRDIMEQLGDVAFWKIAMRPGRPLAFGRIQHAGRSALLFGLPGNPVAVMVSFYFFARGALLQMMGAAPPAPPPLMRARAAGAIRKRPGRTEFQRGILARGADGQPEVRLTGAQGSGILSSMSDANCIVVLGEQQGNVTAGDEVDVILFDGLI